MTPEERESIVNEAVEKAIKLTPDLARQLVLTRVSEDALKLRFLEKLLGDDPRYKKWIPLIQKIVERNESKNPGNVKKALDDSMPEVKAVIEEMEKLDFREVHQPSSLDFRGNPSGGRDMGDL